LRIEVGLICADPGARSSDEEARENLSDGRAVLRAQIETRQGRTTQQPLMAISAICDGVQLLRKGFRSNFLDGNETIKWKRDNRQLVKYLNEWLHTSRVLATIFSAQRSAKKIHFSVT
jgi:hypothetical protein